jgi:hypothetical protein
MLSMCPTPSAQPTYCRARRWTGREDRW